MSNLTDAQKAACWDELKRGIGIYYDQSIQHIVKAIESRYTSPESKDHFDRARQMLNDWPDWKRDNANTGEARKCETCKYGRGHAPCLPCVNYSNWKVKKGKCKDCRRYEGITGSRHFPTCNKSDGKYYCDEDGHCADWIAREETR